MNRSSSISSGSNFFKDLAASYSQYLEYGYPRDPAVYVIRAHPDTMEEILKAAVEQIIVPSSDLKGIQSLGFQVEKDSKLPQGDVVFGPETVTIGWGVK